MIGATVSRTLNLEGNEACAKGAIAAGCRFYAGYPITPSSEIAEHMATELPRVNGVFIQMEDEIASIGAVIGASMGGARAMTATSGPGFSLKQENLGFASAAEIPCVVVNVMRGGPSTGLPTRPGQGDVMQARWGTHGDHPVIVLTPASVGEIYEQTIRAFHLSETLRTPVILLYDEIIGHLRETIDLPDDGDIDTGGRKWADMAVQDYQPYAADVDGVPFMARPGDGYRTHTTGLTHGLDGFPTQDPDTIDAVIRRLLDKLELNRERIDRFEQLECDDAQLLVIAYGITSRAARRAVRQARTEGIPAGLFRPITLWPFPAAQFKPLVNRARAVFVPEMNAGQLIQEVERYCPPSCRVDGLSRLDGEPIHPDQILQRLRELHTHG